MRLAVLIAALAVVVPAVAAPSRYAFAEDVRQGFPKLALYRPGCGLDAAQAARFDLVVSDGHCVRALDEAHKLNPRLLGLIQPSRGKEGGLLAAGYGAYDLIARPLGAIRAFRDSDWLHDVDGDVHDFGSVNVLNLLSLDTALWSSDVVAYWARQAGALSPKHPGIAGVWGDNDLWADQEYAYRGTVLDPETAPPSLVAESATTWDTNYVARHVRLARNLPGLVIGGNDVSSYARDPSAYRGTVPNGWALPGVSSAGMRECAETNFGLYTAGGVDAMVSSAQRFLGAKALDGKQRFLILNNCHADDAQINEFSLAVATIAGMYYWPYNQTGFWASTLSIAPRIPEAKGHWLGLPIAAPQRLASGLWKRRFEHGTVYVNATGERQVVDGRGLDDRTGFFLHAPRPR